MLHCGCRFAGALRTDDKNGGAHSCLLAFKAYVSHQRAMIIVPILALLVGVLFYNRSRKAWAKAVCAVIAAMGLVGFVTLIVI